MLLSSNDELLDNINKSIQINSSYLKHQILPVAKFSFYSGNVTYSAIQNVFNLFERCKELLDTNGNGWSDPITDFSQFQFSIEPLAITKQSNDDDAMKACVNLAMNQNDQDNEEDMLVPLPKMETEESEELSTIWLPLKRKHIFNINSKTSAFILFRYFVMVTQCYNYQGINQSIFNRKLRVWIVENVLPYLEDEKLYPAFGAVLRVLETIKEPGDGEYHGTSNKESKRRNHFLGPHSNTIDEVSSIFDLSSDHDVKWWIKVGSAAAGVVLALLFIFLCMRLCSCRRKSRGYEDSPRNSSCFQRLKRFFRANTNQPDRDEFYPYKKVPSSERKLVFENEKQGKFNFLRKGRAQKSKEKINLPLLKSETESEEDILVAPFKKKSSSVSSANRLKSATFKISESSDESSRGKKPSKSSLKPTPQPTGFLNRIRSQSPKPKPTNR